MNATLAVLALVWPLALLLAFGGWVDRHQRAADAFGRALFRDAYESSYDHCEWLSTVDSEQSERQLADSERDNYFNSSERERI